MKKPYLRVIESPRTTADTIRETEAMQRRHERREFFQSLMNNRPLLMLVVLASLPVWSNGLHLAIVNGNGWGYPLFLVGFTAMVAAIVRLLIGKDLDRIQATELERLREANVRSGRW